MLAKQKFMNEIVKQMNFEDIFRPKGPQRSNRMVKYRSYQ